MSSGLFSALVSGGGYVTSVASIVLAIAAPFVVVALEPSATGGLPLLLLGTPIILGHALSTGDLPHILSGDMDKKNNQDGTTNIFVCSLLLLRL